MDDGTTWGDAFRELIGQPIKKKSLETTSSAAPKKEASNEWYEAVDPSTQKIYYYNDLGETKWKDELSEDETIKIKPKSPSIHDAQLEILNTRLALLEKERDDAKANSDMKLFKKLNAEVREIRQEIDSINAKLSSASLVKLAEKKSAWSKLTETLEDTKVVKEIKKLKDSAPIVKARDVVEDAREVWETSQNPWVYRAHGVYDAAFGESEHAEALKEVRKSDPAFIPEEFVKVLEEEFFPEFVNAFLQGNREYLKQHCGETAYAFANAHIEQRIRDKRKKHPTILGLDNCQLYNFRIVDKVGPVMTIVFIAHQVDCEYDLDGNVVQGNDGNVIGVPYFFAMSRDYDEESAKYKWIALEFSPSAGVAMI